MLPPNRRHAEAQARLGRPPRLRARHAEALARISEAVAEPVRRDELKSQAERLNPDTWVTDAEVAEVSKRTKPCSNRFANRRGTRAAAPASIRTRGRPHAWLSGPGPVDASRRIQPARTRSDAMPTTAGRRTCNSLYLCIIEPCKPPTFSGL